MSHVIAILGLAVLCAVWVLVQVMAGRGPRTCKGDGQCEIDPTGDKTCRRECPHPNTKTPPNVITREDVVRPRAD